MVQMQKVLSNYDKFITQLIILFSSKTSVFLPVVKGADDETEPGVLGPDQISIGSSHQGKVR